MSKRKNKKSQKRHLTSVEIIIQQKGKKVVQAIKEYWKEQDKLYETFNRTASSLGTVVNGEEIFPKDLSSLIWLLRDGIAFVRYKTEGVKKGIDIRVVDISLNDWFDRGWILPVKGGEISLAGFIKGPSNNITFKDCTFNGIYIEFANFLHVYYDHPELAPTFAKAVLDFRLTLLGMILQSGGAIITPIIQQPIQPDKVIKQLQQKVAHLKELLNDDVNEEALQSYLKLHPFLLKAASEVIPKKKLGEDFVTDFVLLNILDQGPVYTLVELERSSHPILTKEGLLSSQVNQAIKQTRDWDIWLESNKSYLRNKLPNFESPQYLIVIGRTSSMSDSEKAYLRSYNREYKNITIMSYDDLTAQAEEFLESLKGTIGDFS